MTDGSVYKETKIQRQTQFSEPESLLCCIYNVVSSLSLYFSTPKLRLSFKTVRKHGPWILRCVLNKAF